MITAMDANGARALALRIEEHQGSVPEQPPTERLATPDAAPIFHWLGIEPPEASASSDRRESA
jgi:hypothetical protein